VNRARPPDDRWIVRPALSLLVVCAALAACSTSDNNAGAKFEPATPGVLTVATAFLPAPGFWEGNPPTRGFEAQLALAIAKHLGLSRVAVKQVPFAQIVSGHLDGADIALSQLTPTKDREKVLDFTSPYINSPPGVLARQGVVAGDVKGLQGLRWVISRVSTLTPILMDQVRPNQAPVVTEDRTGALRVLRSEKADALLLDLPVALGLAQSDPERFHVLGQLSGSNALAAALPNDSHNDEIVDSAIRFLQADGTIDALTSRWLGQNQDDVPLIRTED
jgi:polar amino acid transport system substrate-binding protein